MKNNTSARKTSLNTRFKKLWPLWLAVAVLALPAMVPPAKAQIITLADNNSTAQIDTSSSSGMFSWTTDGQSCLAQHWFWFRVGNVAEAPINTISAPTITTPNAKTLYTRYNNGAYGVEVDYSLVGGSAGSGLAVIAETLTITNATASPLNFHLFGYLDCDLAANPSGDVNKLGRSLSGFFNEAVQTKGLSNMVEMVTVPGADHCEAAFFPIVLNKLNDGVATTLNDTAGPVGPGDMSCGLQWDFNIAVGRSVIVAVSLRRATNTVASAPAPLISIAESGTNLNLSWPGGYTLQSATNVSGTYADIYGVTIPYTITNKSKPKEFFRVRN